VLILDYEAENSTDLNELDVGEPLVVSVSQRSGELKLYNVVYCNVKPRLKSGIFQCISWLNGSVLFFGVKI
jgi:hypothetical protein